MSNLYVLIDDTKTIRSISNRNIGGLIDTGLDYDEYTKYCCDNNIVITDSFYKFIDGNIVKSDIIEEHILNKKIEETKFNLRNRREIECFSIVNRGSVWYNILNENQKNELSKWYRSWLDVTETLEIPEKPEWLK